LKNSLLILLFCWLLTDIQAQVQDSLLKEYHVTSSFFTTDPLSNLYYINEKDELIKVMDNDGRVFTYSNKQLGRPSWIDASSPMKVLVLYPDFQTVVILDSRMGQVALFRLLTTSDGNSYLPIAMCAQPEDDFFWIFDQLSQQLIKLDERGNTVAKSESLLQLFNTNITSATLRYNNQTLFLSDPKTGLMVVDRFGSPVNTYPQIQTPYIQVNRDALMYLNKGEFISLERKGLTSYKIHLPEQNVLQAQLKAGKLYLRTKDAIRVYLPRTNE